MNADNLIQLDHISFNYSREKELFHKVSFSIQAKTFYLIRGPSGSGKSSLLRLLNRLEEPSSGTLLYKETPYSQIPAPELRRQILYIQQAPVTIDGSVKDNLLLPFSFKHNKKLKHPDDTRLKSLLGEFSLESIPLAKQAKNLSLGQQQRLCLIRGLLLEPSVILLDEPTSALDNESSEYVEQMAESLCLDHGKAVVMVSHRDFSPLRVHPKIISVVNGNVTFNSH